MKRREIFRHLGALGIITSLPLSLLEVACGRTAPVKPAPHGSIPDAVLNPLKRPADGASIPVAFLVSDDAVVIDFAGPWEVFTNVMPGGRMDVNTFRLYTVSETSKTITASGGMKIVPDYTFETAPTPEVVVIPAQSNSSEPVLAWIRKASKTSDVTMSVCTGAYLLAQTGLLAGKDATTHHGAYVDFAAKFPDIHVKRGVRFVEDGNLATSGGLSCGIDLALRVVERYYGRDVATQTAYNMEYQGQGWLHPSSNVAYAEVRTSTLLHPVCAVCAMDTDPATAPKSIYRGDSYYFCSVAHKQLFDSAPEKILTELRIRL
jgi:putative intracellular protease/amidase/YHS domain-containing protein